MRSKTSYIKNKKRTKTYFDSEKKLHKISYGYRDIQWFFQFLKLAIDYEDKSLNIGGMVEWHPSETKKYRSERKFVGGTSYKIKINHWSQLNLNDLKILKPILFMTQKEIFNNYEIWFKKNEHLFKQDAVKYISNKKDLNDDTNYFTLQIPRSLSLIDISKQIQKVKNNYNIEKLDEVKKVKFHKGVVHKNLFKMWNVFKLKETTEMTSKEIAKHLGYLKKNEKNSIRKIFDAYERSKYLILNLCKGIFPKTDGI
jgi:hypothetical protein